MFKVCKKKPEKPEALIGKWKLVRSEGSVDVGAGSVTIHFTDNGK